MLEPPRRPAKYCISSVIISCLALQSFMAAGWLMHLSVIWEEDRHLPAVSPVNVVLGENS